MDLLYGALGFLAGTIIFVLAVPFFARFLDWWYDKWS